MFGNWFKTSLLMAAIMALFGVVGAMLGGAQGMMLALAFGLATNLWAYWYSDTMVLRLYNAREVDAASAPALYATVRELTGRAGLPMPRVYLIDEAQPNAFATGRSPEHAALAATTGILHLLTARELRGVLAHELAHVSNRDILTSTITASIAGAISTLAHFGMFFGRSDNDQRIDRYAKGLPLETAEAHPATAQMMIVNPLHGGGMAGLFSTHPPTEERIHRLLALAR